MIRTDDRSRYARNWRLLVALSGVCGVSACATVPAAPVAALAPVAAPKPAAVVVVAAAPAAPQLVDVAPAAVGVASWYRVGRGLHRTCSGQMLDNNALTAASPTLPMGTMVRVTRMDGGGSVLLLVNDRMPREHRILDVTEVAARDLGLLGSGVAQVSVTPVMVADSQ
jgi:rare lipoprotein A